MNVEPVGLDLPSCPLCSAPSLCPEAVLLGRVLDTSPEEVPLLSFTSAEVHGGPTSSRYILNYPLIRRDFCLESKFAPEEAMLSVASGFTPVSPWSQQPSQQILPRAAA